MTQTADAIQSADRASLDANAAEQATLYGRFDKTIVVSV
jgi:hypothetical protein